MSKLVYGITRIVPFRNIKQAVDPRHLLVEEFVSAFEALRKALGDVEGDLRIHLSVESDTSLLPPRCDGNHAGPRCADTECWHQ